MDASCKIQRSIHVFRLVYKYVSRILGTYHFSDFLRSATLVSLPGLYTGCSPFSTCGAMALAGLDDDKERDKLFKKLLILPIICGQCRNYYAQGCREETHNGRCQSEHIRCESAINVRCNPK